MEITAIPIEKPDCRHVSHVRCFACGEMNAVGLGLRFEEAGNGSVSAFWQPSPNYEGYPNRLHGGVIATLLDSAMVHALFRSGLVGFTAEMHVRYHQSISTDAMLWVTGRISSHRRSLYFCEAEIFQESILAARAIAKFMIS